MAVYIGQHEDVLRTLHWDILRTSYFNVLRSSVEDVLRTSVGEVLWRYIEDHIGTSIGCLLGTSSGRPRDVHGTSTGRNFAQWVFCLLLTGTAKVKGSFLSPIAYVFKSRGVPRNCRVQEEETKRQLFGLMCRCGCLLAGSL